MAINTNNKNGNLKLGKRRKNGKCAKKKIISKKRFY